MKWQKNTGVMPSLATNVKVQKRDGSTEEGRAATFDWDFTGQGSDIEYWCHGVTTYPPFDYVEPKVWTAEWDSKRHCYVLSKNGNEWVMIDTIYTHKAEEIADALNAMEERNATH